MHLNPFIMRCIVKEKDGSVTYLSSFLFLTGTFKKIDVSYPASDERTLLNGDKGDEM